MTDMASCVWISENVCGREMMGKVLKRVKNKGIAVQTWIFPEVSNRLRFPDLMAIGT